MATYYVRTDGNDGNTGLGATTGTAWKTIQKALGATGIASGDTVYIAPGVYTEAVTIGGTYSAPTFVIGNPTASLFTGVTPGSVNHSGINAAGTTSIIAGPILSGTTKSYLKFSNIYWSVFTGGIVTITGRYNEFVNCVFESMSTNGVLLSLTALSGQTLDAVVSKCIFYRGQTSITLTGNTNVADTTSISSSLCFLSLDQPISIITVQTKIYNCTTFSKGAYSVVVYAGSASFPTTVYNCIIPGTLFVGAANIMVEDFNRFVSSRQGTIAVGANTTNNGAFGVDIGQSLLFGLNNLQRETSYLGSPNTSYGTATGAPATDLYGVTWSGLSPDAGSGTYRPVGGVGAYYPTERNASTITIAPGSTSQSIELYLGATGLTASTSGLSARYNRTRTASVSIPLVARTIAQAWTAGGFAEVDATNMPGVYRLDLPDAALASGADDVTVVVRGASGTNGAVMTVKLSSGGLTSTQTASAVWGALTNDYTTHGTYGWNVLRADQDSKEGLVTLHQSGGVSRVDADVHAIANDTDAATELKGALLHNGTDYISAELLTPVSAATSVHIGPYQLLADGLGADQPLDVNVGTATSIDVQVTDANGTGIDITGSTVTAKVYNAGGTLVATYSGTATYADNGRLSFGLTTTVTNTSGTYTVTVTRTTGATDTQVFGPLKLYVRPV